jgi:diguanylate cyclase
MGIHDQTSFQPRRGLTGWLRLGTRQAVEDGPQPARAGNGLDPTLAAIGAFLASHRLNVSAFTLAIAHDYVNETDGILVRRIDERIRSGEPLTLDWLQRISHDTGPAAKLVELTELMGRFDTHVEEFNKTNREARSATHEYSSALESHVDELSQVNVAGVVIAELATIAKIMLVRTREIEKQMTRTEQRTRDLRRKLGEARRAAEVDHLTGLPNRRSFEARFETEHAAASEAGDSLCVAFCDIDHFKAINDSHGHDAGDRVLMAVASDLDRLSGEMCHVARHGGEEFVVLLRGKTLSEAFDILDHSRSVLAERRLINRDTDEPFGRVTFSAGVADVFSYPSRSEALKAADEALYQAKQDGRNRIAIAPPAEAFGG